MSVEDVQRALAAAVHENNELRAALKRVEELVLAGESSPWRGAFPATVGAAELREILNMGAEEPELENRS